MEKQTNLIIRKYKPEDRDALRHIAYQTSFLENPKPFVADEEIVADALTLYFTDYEPESSFVAADSDHVIGYLTGAKKLRIMNETFNSKILPLIVVNLIKKGIVLKAFFWKLIFQICVSSFKGELNVPSYEKEYPAIYHINLASGFRGGGIGSQLVKNFEGYLKENCIYSVQVGTMSDEAKNFFMRNGYHILFSSSRSYLRHGFNRTIPYYRLGKELKANNI